MVGVEPAVEAFRHDRLDHVFEHIAFDLLVRDMFTVLGGDDDGINAGRFPVPILDGHLRFSVRTHPGEDLLFPDFRQAFGQTMG